MNDSPVEEVMAVIFGCVMALVTKWLLIREPMTNFQLWVIALLWANMLLSGIREKFYHQAWWEIFTKQTCNEFDDDSGDDSDGDAGEVSNG